jgi:hypothetical protein
MQTKIYAMALMAAAATLFLAVVGVNVALDPQDIYRASKPAPTASANDRYFSYKTYQADADGYDGLLFGSSRGKVVPLDELSRLSGGVKFASFAVYGGLITDHLLVLDHVLREKIAKGLRLRAVVLLFDADIVGTRPLTNRILQYTWPPEVTGESTARFWWRNLTAIQYQAWKEKLRPQRAMAPANAVVADAASLMDAARIWIGLLGPAVANAQLLDQPAGAMATKPERVTQRPYFAHQLAMLERFVAHCRAHDVRLFVAVSPRRSGASPLDEADFRQVIDKASRVTPLWDFTAPQWPSERADLWLDNSHFSPQLAEMMLRRMFGATPSNAHDAIGVRRGE